MSRKSDLFEACKPDNKYIFAHEEYDWDDIVNAFIGGGLYADSHPRYPWFKINDETIEKINEFSRYLVYKEEYDEYYVLDGCAIKEFYKERGYTHARYINGPGI